MTLSMAFKVKILLNLYNFIYHSVSFKKKIMKKAYFLPIKCSSGTSSSKFFVGLGKGSGLIRYLTPSTSLLIEREDEESPSKYQHVTS